MSHMKKGVSFLMLLIRIRMMKMVVLYDFLLLVFRFLEMEGSRVQEPVERLCISTSSGGVDWQYGLGSNTFHHFSSSVCYHVLVKEVKFP